ncbi:MAG: hypothetical protein GEU71_13905 [Actinobacteria bacterium]|nr:hypothetical protein [Actinomycetota bacterium]
MESRARAAGVKVIHVADEVLASLADTSTPQGVVAVVEIRSLDLAALPADADLVVILADVRDPGNAGTILRSALAAGADAAVFGTGSVDPYHPKTVRSGAGALFRLPVVRGLETPAAIEALKASGFTLVGADASADVSYTDVDMTGPVAIVLGNEAWGLLAETAALLDRSVSIPMPGPAESLNVGIAGALLLFEAVRQRRTGNLPQP